MKEIDQKITGDTLRIAVDLMGSDASSLALFEAALAAAEHLNSSSSLIVIAIPEVVDEISKKYHLKLSSPSGSKIIFHPVPEWISMEDDPLSAVRQKRKSSIVYGVHLLKNKQVNAFVSAGNTGALVAASALFLPMLPGISKPALLAMVPTLKGSVAVLDVGGNVACKPAHLVGFAEMAVDYLRTHYGIVKPRVGLLNIGVESKKGTVELRQAYQKLLEWSEESSELVEFVGNIEGREVFQGDIDVLVTDGFTGNVFLKTTEGVSSFVLEQIARLLASKPGDGKDDLNLQHLREYFSYVEHPGAVLCGVDGIVVKCHGCSTSKAFYHSVKGAIKLAERISKPLG